MSEVILAYIFDNDCVHIAPMGTLYMGTYLQTHGISVSVFNFILDNKGQLEEKELEKFKAELKGCICVGVSVMTIQIPKSLLLTNLVKSINPDIKIVWGGVHPTLFPEQTLENRNIDFIVMKEGEKPLLELVTKLKTGKNDFEKIEGLGFKKDRNIIKNKMPPMFDEFTEIMPNWELIEDFLNANNEFSMAGNNYRYVEVLTGKGCPYRCNYCINAILYGKTRRTRTIDSIMTELKIVIKKFDPTMLKIIDENFFMNRGLVEEFCERLKAENIKIKWYALCRVNYFDNYNDAFLKKVKEAGCTYMSFGAESGSEDVLEYLRKDIKPEQTYNAAVKCVRHGIFPIFSFMVGLPGETKKDLLKTLDLIRKIKKLSNKVGFTNLQIIRPYPGGKMYEDCLKYGIYEPKTLEEWEYKSKITQKYLDLKDLPWIKNPEDIEVASRYGSKGLNNYMLEKDINPLLKLMIRIRTILFFNLAYNFIKSDNKMVKRLLRAELNLTEACSDLGKSITPSK